MSDLHDLLERAADRSPAPRFTVSDLERRRIRRERSRRIEAVIVGLSVALAATLVAVTALRPHGAAVLPSDEGWTSTSVNLPPATQPPLEADPDQYYYQHVHMFTRCPVGQEKYCGPPDETWELDAEFWWRPDESGRISVKVAHNYGIHDGTFGSGEFPNYNGIDVSGFPADTAELTSFLLARSRPDGASPAPLVTPPPEGAPEDGRMWRAITDLMQDPHVTPAVRAALLDVAAGLQGAHLDLGGLDPAGRPADVISFGNSGGELIERLYVDPASHELLAWTSTSEIGDAPFMTWLIESAGLADSTDAPPVAGGTSIPTRHLDHRKGAAG